MRKLDEIILHCTDTDSNATIESIRNYHVNTLGWSDIGYHYIIDAHGICHVGRKVTQIGAHCKGKNAHSIGIAYIGHRPNHFQLLKMAQLCCELMYHNPTITRVSLHCYYNRHKTCPNFDKSDLTYFTEQFNKYQIKRNPLNF